jgi:hypothetical protein
MDRPLSLLAAPLLLVLACGDSGGGTASSTTQSPTGALPRHLRRRPGPHLRPRTSAPAPAPAPALGLSYIGCDYYPTTVQQFDGYNTRPRPKDNFAVAVANTSDKAVKITVTRGGEHGRPDHRRRQDRQAHQLPWVNELTKNNGPSVLAKDGAYRLRTDGPVTVYQYNPLAATTTNDASLLLPVNTWTGNYLVAAWQQWSGIPGFYAVTASQDDTKVTLTPSATGKLVQAGGGVAANGTGVVMLNDRRRARGHHPGQRQRRPHRHARDRRQAGAGHRRPQVHQRPGSTSPPATTSRSRCSRSRPSPRSTWWSRRCRSPTTPRTRPRSSASSPARPTPPWSLTPTSRSASCSPTPATSSRSRPAPPSSWSPPTRRSSSRSTWSARTAATAPATPRHAARRQPPAVAQELPHPRPHQLVRQLRRLHGQAGANVTVDDVPVGGWPPIGNTGYSVTHVKLNNAGDGNHSDRRRRRRRHRVYGVLRRYGSYWYPGGLDLDVIPYPPHRLASNHHPAPPELISSPRPHASP